MKIILDTDMGFDCATAAFGNRIIYNTDAVEQTRLNRKLLAADSQISYISYFSERI